MPWLGALTAVGRVLNALDSAYETKVNAETEQQRIAADERIADLNGRLAVLQDKQKSPVFWIIWGWFAAVTALYYTQLVGDVMFGWGDGTTDPLKGQAAEWAQAVVDSIFVTGGAVASVGIVANAVARWKR